MSEIYALIPDRYGVSLVEISVLAARREDGDDLEEAASNAGIDSVSRADMEGLARLAAQGRALNTAGVTA